MKQVKQISVITKAILVQLLLAVKGHPFTHWVLFTQPTLVGGKKTLDLFKGAVYKYATYTIAVNRNYDRAIEIKGEQLGLNFANWTPQPHNYATHIGGNVLCHNNDMQLPLESELKRLYAQFLLHEGCQVDVQYYDAEMQPIDIARIKPYLRNNTSKKQTDFGIPKADQVPVINPAIESIKQVSMNGQIYQVN